MRTFQKEQGGYALLSVMLVVSVVCAVVMLISASAVKNYQAQQASVARMQDKYAAMGEIEMVLAQIEEKTFNVEVGKTVEECLEETISGLNPNNEFAVDVSEDGAVAEIMLSSTVESINVQVVFDVNLTYDSDTMLYTIGKAEIESYEIGGAA